MTVYTCPMHPEIRRNKPGKCPKCGGMDLVPENSLDIKSSESSFKNYLPLIAVIGIILLTTAVLTLKDFQSGAYALEKSLSYFMIGFFITFAGFKLMDLKGFVEGYSTYDLLAKHVRSYGYVYPFIELFFGLGMILLPTYGPLLVAEILVMSFSGIGVAIRLAKKEKFQCVCLGTFLKVPLTKVTLIEDFGMALLALVMLLL